MRRATFLPEKATHRPATDNGAPLRQQPAKINEFQV
jgi:hypothetical protein